MLPNLAEVARTFGRGEATLDTLRLAASADRADRRLADTLLALIAEWESSAYKDTVWSRNELRARASQLAPPVPVAPLTAPVSARLREPAESIYEAGLRGQKRRR